MCLRGEAKIRVFLASRYCMVTLPALLLSNPSSRFRPSQQPWQSQQSCESFYIHCMVHYLQGCVYPYRGHSRKVFDQDHGNIVARSASPENDQKHHHLRYHRITRWVIRAWRNYCAMKSRQHKGREHSGFLSCQLLLWQMTFDSYLKRVGSLCESCLLRSYVP